MTKVAKSSGMTGVVGTSWCFLPSYFRCLMSLIKSTHSLQMAFSVSVTTCAHLAWWHVFESVRSTFD